MNGFRIIRLALISILLLSVLFIFGQQARITVLDKITKEPVVFAHVTFETLKGEFPKNYVTDMEGQVDNSTQESSIIAISYVGYQSMYDTIAPGETKTLLLSPTVFNIDQVVVTAQYTPEKADKSIYKVKVINSKQIDQKGANNLTELLNSELNIRISNDAVLGSSMSIQGLSGEHVKILIDGVPVIGRMNSNIDLNQINLNNVDHVEMIEGPMSVVYGSNALAGVVNIITKEDKNARLAFDINTYLETVGNYNFDGNISYGKGRHSFSLTGGRQFFDGYSVEDTSRYKAWKPKRQYNLDWYYSYNHKDLKLKYSGNYFNELIQSKGELMKPYYETAFDNYFQTNRMTNKLELGSKIGKIRYVDAVLAFSGYKRKRETYFKDLTTLNEVLVGSSEDQFNNYMLRSWLSKSTERSKFNYQAGIDLNVETGKGPRITGEEQMIGDYAAFLSVKYQPVPSLFLQPGVRFIYNTRYNAPLVYSINTKWDINSHISTRASYSRGFRAPALKELYLLFVDVNHNIHGNENLEAEKSHNLNLDFQYHREKGEHFYSADLGFFYNNIENIITLAEVQGTEYIYINGERFISKGIDFSVNYRIYPGLSLKVGVAETGRKNILDSAETDPEEFLWSTDFTTSVNYTIIKYDLGFSVYYKYTGKTPRYHITANGEIVEGYLGAYNTMDISAMKPFLNRSLNVTVGVKNLFDVTYIPSTGSSGEAHSGGSSAYPAGWGRTFFLSLSYKFRRYN